MLEIGKEYQITITSSLFSSLTANQYKKVTLNKVFSVYMQDFLVGGVHRFTSVRLYFNIIELETDVSSNLTIRFYNGDTLVKEITNLINESNILICGEVVDIVNSTDLLELDNIAIESITTRNGLHYNTQYANVVYKGSVVSSPVNLSDKVVGSTFILNATFIFQIPVVYCTFFGQQITAKLVYPSDATHVYLNEIDIYNDILSKYENRKITLTLPYVIPLASSSEYPYIEITANAVPQTQLSISAVSLTNYTINNINNGEIESVVYGENSSTLILKAKTGYHFTENSVESIRNLIDSELYAEMQVEYDNSNANIKVRFIGVKDIIEFEDATISDLKLELDPVLTKNLTGCTPREESAFVNLAQYSLVLTPNNIQKRIKMSDITVTMGGTSITDEVVSIIGTDAYINIASVTGDVVITCGVSDKNTITFQVGVNTFTAYVIENADIEITHSNNKLKFKVDEQESNEYDYTLPVAQKLVGFGLTNTVSLIPVNIKVLGYKLPSVSPVYVPVVRTIPQPTNFELNLYQLNGEKNLVDKTNALSIIGTEVGTLRNSCDIMNPVVEMEYAKVPDFNYVFIPNFNRYYFVKNTEVNENGLWTISLHVDVLMSFKDEIRANTGVIARNEYDFNPLVEDTQRLREKGEEIESINITEDEIFVDTSSSSPSEQCTIVLGAIRGN